MAMTVANFTGGEAEELRRAMGFKRSQERMKDIELRLRRGMEKNGITGSVQETIVQSITSFALYGFPESHAASFALLAYASAFLKCHHLAAFTCALLNNQPMGFYHPAVVLKDAQRHGLRALAVDITRSLYECSLEDLQLRLGLNYVRGLRAQVSREIVKERIRQPFTDIDDLARRVPQLRKDELAVLAKIGALNPLQAQHRRDALWKATRAGRPVGPLLNRVAENDAESPLAPMTTEERLFADYRGTSLTVGRHPMAHHRKGNAGTGCHAGHQFSENVLRPLGAGCWLRHSPAAAGNGKWNRVHQPRRRDRHLERGCDARHVCGASPHHSEHPLAVHRRADSKYRWSHSRTRKENSAA
jgi:error-prone DNA polymerase